ncbi:hypothetical protein SC206_00890 [Rouxiella sp. T17]|uniref:hypothetical protein n=1 Tax=Rouxiella sp. T17 TaxID=3085684 RepID=UPI002FCBFD6E
MKISTINKEINPVNSSQPVNTSKIDKPLSENHSSCMSCVSHICTIANNLDACTPLSQEQYFDALDNQPWLNLPTQTPWTTSLTATALAIKDALHYQLIQLSRFTLANDMLNILPPEISKLLSVGLFCHSRGVDYVYQAGILGGLTLLNTLIYNLLGPNTVGILVASLPHFLLTWLEGEQLPLTSQIISALTGLLHTGLLICASQDLHQPEILVNLYSQVILPAQTLFMDSGYAGIAATGLSLLLCLYSGLRLSGLINNVSIPPNVLNQGFAVIRDIYGLSQQSFNYERQKDGLLKNWYQRNFPSNPCKSDSQASHYSERRAQKALDRAVNHAIPITIRKRYEGEEYFRLKADYQQQILLGQLPVWPIPKRTCVSPDSGVSVQDNFLTSATYETVSSPLLVTSSVIAASTLAPGWQLPGKITLLAGAAVASTTAFLGTFALMGQHAADKTRQNLPQALPLQQISSNSSPLCEEIIHVTRKFLISSKTGWPLAVDLFNTLFQANGDPDLDRLSQFLHAANITTFTAEQRNDVNDYLLDTLSVLLAPPHSPQAWSIDDFISALDRQASTLWERSESVTVEKALQTLRLAVAEHYISLGIIDKLRMAKITEFLLGQIIPAALTFERHEMSSLNLQSKKFYYMLNYIGSEIAENRHIIDKNFEAGLQEGRKDEFYMARLNNYPAKNVSSTHETTSVTLRRKINQDFYDYHEQDIDLESLPMVTFDEIIQIEYSKINIFKKINFNIDSLRIHNQGSYTPDINVLSDCANYRDVIRSFEDGMAILYRYLPNNVPVELRDYNSQNNKPNQPFQLKAHKKMSELKKLYEIANKQAREFYSQKYRQVVDMAVELLDANELSFLRDKDTRIYIIDTEVKRLKFLRFLFMSKVIRLSQEATEKVAYNKRPFHEIGKFFFGYSVRTKECRYYSFNIEGSRTQLGQFPLQRIGINQTKALITLPHDFLNENYLFLDERTLFDPCDKVIEPTIKLNAWDKTGDFFAERLRYYKNVLCKTFTNSKDIIVSLKERAIAINGSDPLMTLKDEICNDRRALLLFLQQRDHTYKLTEREIRQEKGFSVAVAEKLPFYSCFELFKDNFISDKDSKPISSALPFLQAAICAADFYLGYNMVKSFTTLVTSYRQCHIKRWIKEGKVKELTKNLDAAFKLPQSSHTRYPVEYQYQISVLERKISKLDAEIIVLRDTIKSSTQSLLSTPVFIAFPYLSLRQGENLKAIARPWAFNMLKMSTKKLADNIKFKHRPSPYYPLKPPLPGHDERLPPSIIDNNATCSSAGSTFNNIIVNIFDLKITHPDLYKKAFFFRLKDAKSFNDL